LGAIFVPPASLFLVVTCFLAISEAVRWVGADLPGPDLSPAALARLSPSELADVEQRATDDLRSSPLDARSLITLARINDVRNRTEEADRLRLAAGAIRPHDPQIQGEAIPALVKRGDLATVTRRVDGLIRAYPNKGGSLFDLLAALTAVTGGPEAIASQLAAEDAPWRGEFFAYLINAKKTETVSLLFDALSVTNRPVRPEELARLIDLQIKQGAISDAYRNWLVSLSDQERTLVRAIYDGDFEAPVRSLSFDWTVTPSPGLSYQRVLRDSGYSDRNLKMTFEGYSGSFMNLSQLLLLSPGSYQFRGEVSFGETGLVGFGDSGLPLDFSFRTYCRDGDELRLIGETGPLPRARQWLTFEKMFRVPAARCQTQLLRLEAFEQPTSNQELTGEILLDKLSIDFVEE